MRTAAMAVLVILGAACSARSQTVPLPLRVVADIPLGRATSRFDYESFDPKTRRLFIADLAGGRVLVVDTKTDTLAAVVASLPEVHGVLAVPDQDRVYASVTGNNEVATIDQRTMTVVARTPAGDYPNGMGWAAGLGKLYVSDNAGHTVAVIDGARHTLLKTIPLGGIVGNTQYDETDGLIYSNERTTKELVAIDPKSDTVAARWPLPGCIENHGLLIDPARQLAYIACKGNGRLKTHHLKRGDPATFTVDALGGARLRGRVEELSPAAGSEFAVLKPDNATGNFVKVPQRIGVRINVDAGQPDAARLRPGMSVEARVETRR